MIIDYMYSKGIVKKTKSSNLNAVKLNGNQSWKLLQEGIQYEILDMFQKRCDKGIRNLTEYDLQNLDPIWSYYCHLFFILNPSYETTVEGFQSHLLTFESMIDIAKTIDSILNIMHEYIQEFNRTPYYLHLLNYNLISYLAEWYTLYPLNMQTHERINGILNESWARTPKLEGKYPANSILRTNDGREYPENNVSNRIISVITAFSLKKQWRLYGSYGKEDEQEELTVNLDLVFVLTNVFLCFVHAEKQSITVLISAMQEIRNVLTIPNLQTINSGEIKRLVNVLSIFSG